MRVLVQNKIDRKSPRTRIRAETVSTDL